MGKTLSSAKLGFPVSAQLTVPFIPSACAREGRVSNNLLTKQLRKLYVFFWFPPCFVTSEPVYGFCLVEHLAPSTWENRRSGQYAPASSL